MHQTTKRKARIGSPARDLELLEDAARRAPGAAWVDLAEKLSTGRAFLAWRSQRGDAERGARLEAEVAQALRAAGLEVEELRPVLDAMVRVHRRAAALEGRFSRLVQRMAWSAVDGRELRRYRSDLVGRLVSNRAEVEVLEAARVAQRVRARTRSGRARRAA